MTSIVQQLAWDRLAATELDPVNPPSGAVVSILDVMPDSLASEDDVKDLAWVIDRQLGRLFNRTWLSSPLSYLAQIPTGKLLGFISSLPGDIYNEVAYNFGLGASEIIWYAPATVKQDLFSVGYKLQKKAGTKWALDWMWDLMGLEGEIVLWYDDTGSPPANSYRIRITSDAGGKSFTYITEAILFWCDRFAPKASKLREIRYNPNGTIDDVLWNA